MSFNPLEYPLCLAEPRRLSSVASWHEHIPFAFAVVQMTSPRMLVELGTHMGDSYLAFCQAVDTLGLATRCFAVDTWRGDEHAGLYDESVYATLSTYHEPLYGKFSTLLRTTFDDAVGHFEEGAIDLLHIDGLHTYDAVRHDFETWLPKMSASGVVLMHDTHVRSRGFDVWKLFEELRTKYPSFAFQHGYGLGVLAVGRTVPPNLASMLNGSPQTAATIAELFHLLGSRHAAKFQVEQRTEALAAQPASPAKARNGSLGRTLAAPFRSLLRLLR